MGGEGNVDAVVATRMNINEITSGPATSPADLIDLQESLLPPGAPPGAIPFKFLHWHLESLVTTLL